MSAIVAGAASANEISRRVDAARLLPDAGTRLVAMLAEESPVYAGRGSADAERLRGYILASFEQVGLPPDAVPYVLEELETGRTPYTVAAAGRALRGASSIPDEAPGLVVRAIARMRGRDMRVSFESFDPASAPRDAVTAIHDLSSTLVVLGLRASGALHDLERLVAEEGATFSTAVRVELERAAEALADVPEAELRECCCGGSPADGESRFAGGASEVAHVLLENQDATRLSFSEAFAGRPTALAFFYTRCMNPEKCSLTVARLAKLARRAEQERLDVNVAGISYDPAFDRPARLRAYGSDRGMIYSPRCSLLRTVGSFAPLVTAFALGVGYGPVTVNRHRLDVVVLDSSLRITRRFERRLWHEEAVLASLREVGDGNRLGRELVTEGP